MINDAIDDSRTSTFARNSAVAPNASANSLASTPFCSGTRELSPALSRSGTFFASSCNSFNSGCFTISICTSTSFLAPALAGFPRRGGGGMSSSSKLFAENAASATRTTPTAANRLDRLGPARSPKPDPLAAEDADASVAAPAGRDSGDNNTAVSAAPGVVALALDVTDSCKGNFCALTCGSVLFTPIGASGAVAASGAAFVFAGVFAGAVFAGVFTVFAFAVFAGVFTVFAFAFTVFTVAFAVFTVFTVAVAVFAAFAVAVFAVVADSRI